MSYQHCNFSQVFKGTINDVVAPAGNFVDCIFFFNLDEFTEERNYADTLTSKRSQSC